MTGDMLLHPSPLSHQAVSRSQTGLGDDLLSTDKA